MAIETRSQKRVSYQEIAEEADEFANENIEPKAKPPVSKKAKKLPKDPKEPSKPTQVKNAGLIETFSRTPPGKYSFVPAGNQYRSLNCKKRALAENYNVYVVKEWSQPYRRSGRNYPPRTAGLMVPTFIKSLVEDLGAQTKEKRSKAVKRLEQKDHHDAMKTFDEVYPKMPQKTREEIFQRAFAKGI